MFDDNHDENSNKPTKKGNRVRVREVDFIRAEGTVAQGRDLAPFELEVKEVLAGAQSPFEELVAQEDRSDEYQVKRISKYRLTCLFRKVKLSPIQAECYRLIWIKKLSEPQAARELGFSRSRVRNLKKIIRIALMTALEKEKQWNLLAIRARSACKTKKQFQIWKLYFNERKTLSEIARNLKWSRQAVHQVLKRIVPEG